MVSSILKNTDAIFISGTWGQHALSAYLHNEGDAWLEHIAQVNALQKENLRLLSEAAEKVLGWKTLPKKGGMYAIWKHNEASDEAAFQKALRAGIGVAPGSIFYNGQVSNN